MGGEGGGGGGRARKGMGRGVRATILISDTLYHIILIAMKTKKIVTLGVHVYVNSSFLNSTNLVLRKCLFKENKRFLFKFS